MPEPTPSYRFGPYELRPRTRELYKAGTKLRLRPQPFQVLGVLVEHAGDMVTREELRELLWSSETFVDFEHGLNTAIKELRGALNDSASEPRYIETLPKLGYRLIVPVEVGEPHPKEGIAQSRTSDSGNSAGEKISRGGIPQPLMLWRWPILFGISIVLAMALASGSAWLWRKRTELAVGTSSNVRSLAVLPLENFSGNPEQDYLSDGMTEALITDLSKLGAVKVTSRTSIMRYKKSHKSLPEIAQELNVDGVIEGSVMRSGNRVRIVAQLIQARTDQHLWAETYERDLGDVLKLQSEVAQAIAQQVRLQLTPQQQARLHSAPAVNPAAYEAYLKGQFYLPNGTEADLKEAKRYFEEAAREDPGFALAYVGLADCYSELGTYRWIPPQDAYRHGSQAIHKALQLDQTLGEAHSTLGYLDWQYSWDWEGAERELRQAVDLNPNYVEGHETLVWYLAWSGRRDEALAEVQKIRLLDPAYPVTFGDESGVYYHQRDYKSLIEASEQSIITNPNSWSSHYFLAVGYEGSGQLQRAIPEYQRAVDLSQRNSDAIAGLAHVYATVGKRVEAEKILGDLQRQSKTSYVSPYMIAAIYSGLGQNDKAIEFLERAYQERTPDIAYFIRADLRMDTLRLDPRFQALLRRIRLPQ